MTPFMRDVHLLRAWKPPDGIHLVANIDMNSEEIVIDIRACCYHEMAKLKPGGKRDNLYKGLDSMAVRVLMICEAKHAHTLRSRGQAGEDSTGLTPDERFDQAMTQAESKFMANIDTISSGPLPF